MPSFQELIWGSSHKAQILLLAVSLPYYFFTNTHTSAAVVFTQHFMWYQESKGDVLNKQDYPLDRTQTQIPEFKRIVQAKTCSTMYPITLQTASFEFKN